MFLATPRWIRPDSQSLIRFLIFLALTESCNCQRPAPQSQAQFPQQPQPPALQQLQFQQPTASQQPQLQQPQFQQQTPQQQPPQQQSQFQQQQTPFQGQPFPQQRLPGAGGPGPLPPGQFVPNQAGGPPVLNNGTVPFQLSSNINLGTSVGRAGGSQFTRFQIWFLAAKVLATVDERSRPDYVLTLQPPLQKGIPAHNISQVLLNGAAQQNPEVLRTLVEQASGMLISQQAVIVQRLRMRLGEPLILRTILSTQRPFEIFRFFNPQLLVKNMGTIIKTIKDTPDTSRLGLKAIQVKLLPSNLLSAWLTWVRTTLNVPRWTVDDLSGKSFLGAGQQLNLAIMGLGCGDLDMVPVPEILPLLARYRQELYELRKHRKDLGFPLNLRNCALARVVQFLKLRNGTVTTAQLNILGGLRPGEVSAIGGEILTAIPTAALENIPTEIRQEILEEVGRVEMMDLFRLVPIDQLMWYANKLLSDLGTPRTNPLQPPPPVGLQITDALSPIQTRSVPLDAPAMQRMGSLLCYGNLSKGNWSRAVLREVLDTKSGEGEKTCCLGKGNQQKWAELLKETYGPDTSAWSPTDLVGVGDLLIALPDEDVQKISTDALGKAVVSILRQSGFVTPLDIIGEMRPVPFIQACVDTLGPEGQDFLTSYKKLMRKLVEASQWMVNSVKTLDQVITDGMGLPRPRVTRTAQQAYAYQPQQLQVPYWRHLRSPTSYQQPGYPVRIRRQVVPVDPPLVNLNPTFPAPIAPPNRVVMGPAQGSSQPIRTSPPLRAMSSPQQTPRKQTSAQQMSSRQPIIAAPMRTSGNKVQAAGNSPQSQPQNQMQAIRVPPVLSAQPTRPATAKIPLGPQLSIPMISTSRPSQLQSPPPPVLNRPKINTNPTQVQNVQNQFPQTQTPTPNQNNPNPSFTKQSFFPNPNIQNPNFQNPSMQNPNFQNPNMQNPNFQNPNFQNPNLQNPNMQNPNFQNVNLQNPNVQNPNLQNPTFQNANFRNPNFQKPNFGNPTFPNSNFQSSNNPTLGQSPNDQSSFLQSGNDQRQPGPAPDQKFPTIQTRSQEDHENVSISQNTTMTGSTSVNDEKVRSLPTDDVSSQRNLTCLGIKAAGPAAIGLTEDDFGSLPAEELFDCIETFGNIKWDERKKRSILKLYREKLNLTTNRLDTLNLIELGSLVTALSTTDKKSELSLFGDEDLQALTSTTEDKSSGTNKNPFDVSALDLKLPNSIDTLSILGLEVTDPDTLRSIADKFSEDNKNFPGRGKGSTSRPDLLRVTVLSLGNILCGMDEAAVQTLFEADRSLFIDVSPMLGRLESCSFETLTILAQFAVQPANYGPPQSWTREDVNTIGVIVAGLSPELFATLQPEALEGLQPSAVLVIPTASLQSLSLEQLSNISYEAAASIQSPNVEVLSQDQIGALNRVLSVQGDDFNIPPVSSTVLDIPVPEEPRSLDKGPDSPQDPIAGRTPGDDSETWVIVETDPNAASDNSTGNKDEETRSLNAEGGQTHNHTTTSTTSSTTSSTTPAPAIVDPPPAKMDTPQKETSSANSRYLKSECWILGLIPVIISFHWF